MEWFAAIARYIEGLVLAAHCVYAMLTNKIKTANFSWTDVPNDALCVPELTHAPEVFVLPETILVLKRLLVVRNKDPTT